jgi:hypothetical protein
MMYETMTASAPATPMIASIFSTTSPPNEMAVTATTTGVPGCVKRRHLRLTAFLVFRLRPSVSREMRRN